MEKLHFLTKINAPKEKVWKTLWEDHISQMDQCFQCRLLRKKPIGKKAAKCSFSSSRQKHTCVKILRMTSVIKATERDYNSIVSIGKVSIAESHRGSCSAEDMNEFLERDYNNDAIKKELNDINNIYYIINYNDKPDGFSKIILNAKHPNIVTENVAKLDRIYLLKEFYGLKLGLELLNFNIELSRDNNQSGIWLYTWIGNNRAANFYLKAGFTIIGNYKYYVTKAHYDPSYQLFLNFLEPKVHKVVLTP